jgi:hypothetical protein
MRVGIRAFTEALAAIDQYFEQLSIRCLNNGIDFMPAPIEEGYNQVLLKYLLKRQQLY